MTEPKALDRLIADEAAHAERTPLPAAAQPTRRGNERSRVYSIRLNEDEWDAVNRLAAARDVPPSAMVRGWIVKQLEQHAPPRPRFIVHSQKPELSGVADAVRRSA